MERQIERRSINPAEMRFVDIGEQNKAPRLAGYAALFNSLSEVLSTRKGSFREILKPGAFKHLDTDDIRLLINHDDLPLARNTSGTLLIKQDDRGLYFESELDPDDPDVRRIIPKLRRGDLSQMSFGFYILGDNWRTDSGQDVHEVDEVSVFDISIVTYPAYPATEVSMRSYEQWKAEAERTQGETISRALKIKQNNLEIVEG